MPQSVEEAGLERARRELKTYLRDNPKPDDHDIKAREIYAQEVMWRSRAVLAWELKRAAARRKDDLYRITSSSEAAGVWEGWLSRDPSLAKEEASANRPLPPEVILWLDPSSGPAVSLPLDCSPGSL